MEYKLYIQYIKATNHICLLFRLMTFNPLYISIGPERSIVIGPKFCPSPSLKTAFFS